MSAELSGNFHGGRNFVGHNLAVNPQWRDIGHADALQLSGRAEQAKKNPELTLS
jgi:hypothetical protein